MTRRILLTLTASVLLVLLAFLAPLWIFVSDFSVDRAQRQAVLQVQPLVSSVALVDRSQAATLVAEFEESTGRLATVYYPDDTTIGSARPADDAIALARRGGAFFAESSGGRDLVVPVVDGEGQTLVVRVLVPDEVLFANVTSARVVLLVLGAGLLLMALIVGLVLARSFLRPVQALSRAARSLASGDLDSRVEPEGPPELRAVAAQLNLLAGRVTELLRGEREQVADVAHRLRTPVTALRLNAEALTEDETRDRLVSDVDRLERMVDEVIREARRPVREGARAVCDAAAVVRDRLAFWGVLAEDQARPATAIIPTVPVRVRVDAADLGDTLDALLGNVFAHTPDGAAYAVRVSARTGGGALVTVDDAGPGLPHEGMLERGRSTAGSTGLGLDIARRTAESSGGALSLGRAPLGGTRVSLELGAPTSGASETVASPAKTGPSKIWGIRTDARSGRSDGSARSDTLLGLVGAAPRATTRTATERGVPPAEEVAADRLIVEQPTSWWARVMARRGRHG